MPGVDQDDPVTARKSSSDGWPSSTIWFGYGVLGKRLNRTRPFDQLQLANHAEKTSVVAATLAVLLAFFPTPRAG
jgi:hypothetical protein